MSCEKPSREASQRAKRLRVRPALILLAVGLAALGLLACGGGSSGGEGTQAEGSPAAVMKAIYDRAKAAGYDFVPCTDQDSSSTATCSGDVFVTSDDATLFLQLYGAGTPSAIVPAGNNQQKFGVYAPGFTLLKAQAFPTEKAARASLARELRSTNLREAVRQDKGAYAVIGNRYYVDPGASKLDILPRISQQDFLKVIGALEGCEPDCHWDQTSAGH